MRYFAKINNKKNVTQIIILGDEIKDPEKFISDTLKMSGYWLETWKNGDQRKNFAGVGYTYNEEFDAFIAPKPFDSWILDEETCLWISPIAKPDDEKEYFWDEETKSWVEVTEKTK